MPLSPLDKTISSSQNSRGRKSRWVALAVFSVAGLASIGSVFAASVTLNGGADISFSQGVETIAACDTDGIGADLGAALDTTASPAVFVLDAITLTDVDSGCNDKALTITIYDGAAVQLTITGTLNTTADGTTVSIAAAGDDVDIVADDGSNNSNTYTAIDGLEVVTYEAGQTSADVASGADRITIEINEP